LSKSIIGFTECVGIVLESQLHNFISVSSNNRLQYIWLVALALLIPAAGLAVLQEDPSGDRILNEYIHKTPEDPIAHLQEKITSGETKLHFDKKWGYLPAVLRALNIPDTTQSLVFSKSSFQIDHISVGTPRALYFSDDVYVGWVQGGPVLEFASIDPVVGSIFYTLPQKETDLPQFERLNEGCLVCHDSAATAGVPGLLMRSVLVDQVGNPILSAGSSVMTDRSSLLERFGGWYVTGTSGGQQHRGNSYYPGSADNLGNARTYVARMNLAPTSNLTSLPQTMDATKYLTPHSDIVALMVFTHQTQIHNRIAKAAADVRSALLDEGKGAPLSEVTQNRIRNAVEPLVAQLLFAWTPEFTEPVAGTSGFAAEFAKQGPFDSQGRTLRQLDLKTRLFRYPLSYLIYSESFNALPGPAKDYVYRRLRAVLTGADTSSAYSHLSDADRKAILHILEDTKPDFAGR